MVSTAIVYFQGRLESLLQKAVVCTSDSIKVSFIEGGFRSSFVLKISVMSNGRLLTRIDTELACPMCKREERERERQRDR